MPNQNRKQLLFALLLVVAASASAAANQWRPERRRDQFPTDPGWAAAPYVFDIPGIGRGFGVLGAITNVRNSTTDLLITAFGGDVNGQAFGVNSWQWVPRHLIVDIGGAHLSRTTIQNFNQRGMGSSKHDYSLAEFGSTYFDGVRLTASFDDRRYEAYVGYYGGSTRLNAVRDRDGNLIIDSQDAPRQYLDNTIAGIRLDLTDDYQDPRRGLNIEPSIWKSPPRGSSADSYFLDTSLTAYLPVGRRNSFAFNYYRSDSHVLKEGVTDPAEIQRELGLDCASLTDPTQKAQCDNVVNNVAAANRYGTASALGGTSRLRSYPEQRFRGAHTEFVGAEYRWNVTDERKPFNIYIMKDVRTTMQFAFFYEVGTVAETRGDLWTTSRSSYGTGFRVVTASGLVYRIDLAFGSEGAAPNIFFQYPWQR